MGRADGGILKLRELLEDNPEWESDLWALYHFDIQEVFKGRASLQKAILLIERLAHDPNSHWRAKQLGGPEHIGWSHETYLLADQVDAVMALYTVQAHKGKKGRIKYPDPVYRPKVDGVVEKQAKSLDEFDIHGLMAQIQIG